MSYPAFIRYLLLFIVFRLNSAQISDLNYLGGHFVANRQQDSGRRAVPIKGPELSRVRNDHYKNRLPSPPSPAAPPSTLPIADNLWSRQGAAPPISNYERDDYGDYETLIPFDLPEADLLRRGGTRASAHDSLPSIIAVDPAELNLGDNPTDTDDPPLFHLQSFNKRRGLGADNLLTHDDQQETTYVVLEPVNFRKDAVPPAQPLRSQPQRRRGLTPQQRFDRQRQLSQQDRQHKRQHQNRYSHPQPLQRTKISPPPTPPVSTNKYGRSTEQHNQHSNLNIPFILPPRITQRTSKLLQSKPNRPIYALISGSELGEVLDHEFESTKQRYIQSKEIFNNQKLIVEQQFEADRRPVQQFNAGNLAADKKDASQWGYQKSEPRIQYSAPKSYNHNTFAPKEVTYSDEENIPSKNEHLHKTYTVDQHTQCCSWSFQNECVTNPSWMLVHCPQSCGVQGCSYSNWHQCGVPIPPRKCSTSGYRSPVDQVLDFSARTSAISQPSPQATYYESAVATAKPQKIYQNRYPPTQPPRRYNVEQEVEVISRQTLPPPRFIPKPNPVTPLPSPSVPGAQQFIYPAQTQAPIPPTQVTPAPPPLTYPQPVPQARYAAAATTPVPAPLPHVPVPNWAIFGQQQQQYLQGLKGQYPSIVIPIPIPVPVGQQSKYDVNPPAPPRSSELVELIQSSSESAQVQVTPTPTKRAPAPPPKQDLTNEQLLEVLKQLLESKKKVSTEETVEIPEPGTHLEYLLAKLAAERKEELPQLLSNPIERLMVNLVSANTIQQRSTLIDTFLDNYDIV